MSARTRWDWLAGSIDLACVLLRTNLAQDQAASIFGVSQATAPRCSDLLRDVLAAALCVVVPTVREVRTLRRPP